MKKFFWVLSVVILLPLLSINLSAQDVASLFGWRTLRWSKSLTGLSS